MPRNRLKPSTSGLLDAGIIGGLPLGPMYPELANGMLLCVTEQRSKADIDALVAALKG